MKIIEIMVLTLLAALVSILAADAATYKSAVTTTRYSAPKIQGRVSLRNGVPSSFDSVTASYALQHPKKVLDQDMQHYRTAVPGRLLY